MRKIRPRMNRDQWTTVLEQQSQSGLSVEVFCEQQDIGLASFAKWRKRLKDAVAKPLHQQLNNKGFEPVQLIESVEPQNPICSSVSVSIGADITLTIQTHGSMK